MCKKPGGFVRTTVVITAALPLLGRLADVRLHVFGRCGHVPAIEHPQEFRELLSCFLRPDRGH
jgi:2-hydroxymuconate-semialdehyde hydrolase/2-hydroxy-6-oxo-octa-2,4-dienoate hydrolase